MAVHLGLTLAGLKPSSLVENGALKDEIQRLWLAWTDEADAASGDRSGGAEGGNGPFCGLFMSQPCRTGIFDAVRFRWIALVFCCRPGDMKTASEEA